MVRVYIDDHGWRNSYLLKLAGTRAALAHLLLFFAYLFTISFFFVLYLLTSFTSFKTLALSSVIRQRSNRSNRNEMCLHNHIFQLYTSVLFDDRSNSNFFISTSQLKQETYSEEAFLYRTPFYFLFLFRTILSQQVRNKSIWPSSSYLHSWGSSMLHKC